MSEQNLHLGKLQAVYPLSPLYLQRAAGVAVISFIFFLAMLIAFSIRQNIGYFVLSTAFLIVELFTLFGWLGNRKAQVKLFANGFSYKKFVCLWEEIKSVETNEAGKISCIITKKNGEKTTLTEAIYEVGKIVETIKERKNLIEQ